jgi:hypothetical protein
MSGGYRLRAERGSSAPGARDADVELFPGSYYHESGPGPGVVCDCEPVDARAARELVPELAGQT